MPTESVRMIYNRKIQEIRSLIFHVLVLREPLREMDRYRLIAEVHKRPALWDPLCLERTRLKVADLWKEVASLVGGDLSIDELKCKWKHMRDAYRTETKRALHRIERDKRKGRFDPNKNYGSKWEYYDLMKFIDIKVRCNCNNCSKNTKNNQQTQQQQRHVYLTSPPPLRKFNNLITHNNTYYEINVLENHEKDNEIRPRPLSCHSNDISHHNSIDNLDIKEESIMDADAEEISLHNSRYHRIDSEEETATTSINHNETSEVYGVNIKEERCIDLDSDCIYPSDEEEFIASHNKKYRKDTSIYNSSKKPRLMDKIDSEKEFQLKSSMDITDPDTNFLISFSSHMKSLTQLQNLQFRCKMSELVLNTLTNNLNSKTSSSSSSSANQESNLISKTFVNITDPDCNFLISFRLHLKSMTQLENLQFRAKMSELMVNILQSSLTANENSNTTISDSTTPEGSTTKNPT